MRDASLDEFLSESDEDKSVGEELEDEAKAEPEAQAEPEAESEIGTEPDTDPEVESDAEPATDTEADSEDPLPVAEVEPARSTFAWSPDGATCTDCGERVEERWESEMGLVCVACKEW